ncbi:MAG: cytochrome c-type biogenesis protein [Dehalococcoidia bacterium]
MTVAIGVAFSLSANVHAQTPEPASPEPVIDESEAQNIDRRLMCPVCPAQTIAQSQVEIALQMRAIVREMLAEGEDRDGILDFFVERYGKDILAAPPKSGANLVAWLLPIAGVSAALVAVFFIIRSMAQRRPVPATLRPVQDDGLAPYLRLVDRHLAVTPEGGTSNSSGSAVESSGTDPLGRTDATGPDERR